MRTFVLPEALLLLVLPLQFVTGQDQLFTASLREPGLGIELRELARTGDRSRLLIKVDSVSRATAAAVWIHCEVALLAKQRGFRFFVPLSEEEDPNIHPGRGSVMEVGFLHSDTVALGRQFGTTEPGFVIEAAGVLEFCGLSNPELEPAGASRPSALAATGASVAEKKELCLSGSGLGPAAEAQLVRQHAVVGADEH